MIFIVVVFVECKITLNNEFMICQIDTQNQLLNVFLDRRSSTLLIPFRGSKRMSGTLYCHFCMNELPSGNYVSDLPFMSASDPVTHNQIYHIHNTISDKHMF